MKKLICTSLTLICLAASLVSCGDSKDKDSAAASKENTTAATEAKEAADSDEEAGDFIGKWQCEKLVIEDKETDNFYGVDAYALFQIELKDGNKGTFYSFLYSEEGKPTDIEWEEKDGKIQLISKDVFADDEVFLVNEGGKMILNLSDEGDDKKNEATLEKVDEFKEIPEDMEMSFSVDGEAEADFELDEEDLKEEAKDEVKEEVKELD